MQWSVEPSILVDTISCLFVLVDFCSRPGQVFCLPFQVRDGLVVRGGGDVPAVLSSARPLSKRKLMRVVRANLDNGQKVIGIQVEHRHLALLVRVMDM